MPCAKYFMCLKLKMQVQGEKMNLIWISKISETKCTCQHKKAIQNGIFLKFIKEIQLSIQNIFIHPSYSHFLYHPPQY